MNTVQQLHSKAIELADLAFIQKFHGNEAEAADMFRDALNYEKEAAFRAKSENVGEPTISVLFRSAAAIALNAGDWRESEKLISFGLAGDPPLEIAEEMRNLLEDIYFERHLKTHGVNLSLSEVQMVIAGKGVAYGMAKMDEVRGRLDTFEKLTFRTIERRLKHPFRDRGGLSADIRETYHPFLSVPRAASFAVTIRLGEPTNQLSLPGTEAAEEILDDIVENIELVNEVGGELLSKRISNQAYFRNFVSLVKMLAPDGDDVSLVGFTIVRNGEEKRTSLQRLRSDFASIIPSVLESDNTSEKNIESTEVTGRLFAADSARHNLKIVSEDKQKYTVKVPEGLGDIVRSYFEETVIIRGYINDKKEIDLIDIEPLK